ncbi:MAG: TetR/AcrR family transcriptional regulator [Arcanobacterium sp.]|nr:TetR/AcrR family transcriptional regulator [Arcanobacterium sp.]MDY5589556.1 TetR/AcrR family transcriptional regulator C-terminal domain-containing protein [Arcanobacterium sp.]
MRTRLALRSAIFELAATKRAEDITVSELTSAAGVSRGAFYSHATSPAELLAKSLIHEIKPSFSAIGSLLSESHHNYMLRWRSIYVQLFEHVRQHSGIYQHIFLSKPESIVLGHLSAYLREAVGSYVHEFVGFSDELVSDLWISMAIEQQVHNTIAMLTSWIELGMEASPETAVNTFMSLAPPWQFAKFGDDGRIRLRRTHALSEMLENRAVLVANSALTRTAAAPLPAAAPIPAAAPQQPQRTRQAKRAAASQGSPRPDLTDQTEQKEEAP